MHVSPLAHVLPDHTSSACPVHRVHAIGRRSYRGIRPSDVWDVLEMSRSIGGADGDHLALPGWAACPVAQDTDTQQAGSLVQVTSTTLHIIDV